MWEKRKSYQSLPPPSLLFMASDAAPAAADAKLVVNEFGMFVKVAKVRCESLVVEKNDGESGALALRNSAKLLVQLWFCVVDIAYKCLKYAQGRFVRQSCENTNLLVRMDKQVVAGPERNNVQAQSARKVHLTAQRILQLLWSGLDEYSLLTG